MFFERKFALLHLLSLLVALGFLLAAMRRPRLARKLYAGLFAYAALVNSLVCWRAPQSYVDNAQYALLQLYRTFILGWFAQHVRPVIGLIAALQALIALGLLEGGRAARAGLLGATLFFLGIAPLGVGSAFPSSLIWAWGALWLMFDRNGRAALTPCWLWQRPSQRGART
jgi:hypothetical protein